MDEEKKTEQQPAGEVIYTKPDEQGVSYYQIRDKDPAEGKTSGKGFQEKKSYSKNHSVRNALIIIGSIIAGVIILGVSCTQITGNFLNGIGFVTDTTVYNEEPQLPSYDYIAQISVEGTIQESNADIFGSITGYQQQWTLDLIDDLILDDNNKGLIVWVDSPGGSVYESDELYLAIKNYQDTTDRPVYSVMGSMAASGGYYISAPCDKIIASRNTWTGSIGVTMGTFFDVTGLLESYGIKTVTITSGENKAMGSAFEPMTEEQLAIFRSLIDQAYEQFVGIVAEGRGMTVDEVKALADGRIYTANQALDIGLIDSIGTFDDAVADMQKTYGLKDCKVEDFNYTEKSPLSNIFGELSNLIKDSKTSDLAILDEMMDANDQFMPMYLYQQ